MFPRLQDTTSLIFKDQLGVEEIHVQPLLATFAAWVARKHANIIACLIEENHILMKQPTASGKRIRFTDNQRRRLAARAKVLGFVTY